MAGSNLISKFKILRINILVNNIVFTFIRDRKIDEPAFFTSSFSFTQFAALTALSKNTKRSVFLPIPPYIFTNSLTPIIVSHFCSLLNCFPMFICHLPSRFYLSKIDISTLVFTKKGATKTIAAQGIPVLDVHTQVHHPS